MLPSSDNEVPRKGPTLFSLDFRAEGIPMELQCIQGCTKNDRTGLLEVLVLACRPGTWLLWVDRSSSHGSLQRRLHRARRRHLWSCRLWRSVLLLEHGL